MAGKERAMINPYRYVQDEPYKLYINGEFV